MGGRVLALGTYDCFHLGHLRLLERAAGFGELHVGVNSDRFATAYKRVPSVGETERLVIVGALRCVHAAFLNDGPGRDLIDRARPSLLVVGSDWHENGYLAQIDVTRDWLDERGVAVLYLPRTPGVSTTERRR